MVKVLIDGKPLQEVLRLASQRLKASREELFDALQGELTPTHRFVLDEWMRHIEKIEARIARFDARLLEGLADEREDLALLQILPGVDRIRRNTTATAGLSRGFATTHGVDCDACLQRIHGPGH